MNPNKVLQWIEIDLSSSSLYVRCFTWIEWIQGIDRAVEELGEWLRKVRAKRTPLELKRVCVFEHCWSKLSKTAPNRSVFLLDPFGSFGF